MTLHAIASALAAILGHGLWASVLIAGIAAGSVWVLDRTAGINSTTRHGIWTAALAGIVMLHVSLASVKVVGTGDSVLPPTEGPTLAGAVHSAPQAVLPTSAETASPTPIAAEPAASGQGASVRISSIELPEMAGRVLLALGVVWLIGALIAFRTLILGLLRVRALKREAEPVSAEIHARIMDRIPAGGRRVVIATAPVASPVATGYRSPMVLLPTQLVRVADRDTLDQVALHEVAHVRRGDDWALLFQRVVEALLWFNPAVLAVGRWMQSEREGASDEWVVAATGRPADYARSLGRMLELRLVGTGLHTAPGLAARESDVVRRVRRLLEQGAAVSARGMRGRAGIAVGLIALVAALSVLRAPAIDIAWGHGEQDANFVPAQLAPMPSLAPLPPLPALAPRPPRAPMPDPAPPAPLAEPAPWADEAPPAEPAPVADPEPPAPSAMPVAGLGRAVPARALGLAPTLPATLPATAEADLTVAGWKRLLAVARGIQSSGDRARVLANAASKLPNDNDVHRSFLEVAAGIPSSGDRGRVLRAYIQGQDSGHIRFPELIRAVSTIPSSGDRAAALIAVANVAPADESVQEALLDAAEQVPSSTDRVRVLRALIR